LQRVSIVFIKVTVWQLTVIKNVSLCTNTYVLTTTCSYMLLKPWVMFVDWVLVNCTL